VRAGFERGFAAWVDFFCLVDGVVPGLNGRPASEKLPSGVKQAAEKLGFSSIIGEERPSVAKAIIDSIGFTRGLKPPSPSALSFSAACKTP
jgi:hypothetical protein